MRGSYTITPMMTKVKMGIRPLPIQEEIEKPISKEYKNPPPLFLTKCGCYGKSENQIFWYVGMGGENFGIHMNAKQFEKRFDGCDPKVVCDIFFHGIVHEYFHHLVDSWCVKSDIDRNELLINYTKEKRNLRPIFMLEESMAEAIAGTWSGMRYEIKSGAYSLSEPFKDSQIWRAGSIVVANQYLDGKYKINDLTPLDGFNKSNLNNISIESKWEEKINFNSILSLEKGFTKSLNAGVWSFGNIHFHVHESSMGTHWHDLRRFYADKFNS